MFFVLKDTLSYVLFIIWNENFFLFSTPGLVFIWILATHTPPWQYHCFDLTWDKTQTESDIHSPPETSKMHFGVVSSEDNVWQFFFPLCYVCIMYVQYTYLFPLGCKQNFLIYFISSHLFNNRQIHKCFSIKWLKTQTNSCVKVL